MNWINLIVSVLISTINIYMMIKLITKERYDIKRVLMFIIVLSILYVINLIIFDGLSRILFSISIIFLCMYVFLFKNTNKSLYYSILYIILSFLSEIIVCVILEITINFSTEKYNQFNYSLLIFTICSAFFVTLISKNKKISEKLKRLESNIFKSNTNNLYILILVVLLILFEVNNKITYGSNIDYYLNIMIIVFIIVTIIMFIINLYKKNNIENKYKEMMEYVSKYEKIINEQGKKNHEFNNQLMVINGYINDKKKLKEYLDMIINEHKGGKNYTIEQLSYFPDGGIKGLIYHKLSKMEDNGIRPYLYIDQNLKDIFETKFDINTYSDITKLFGVFLDNAIDAAKVSEKKEIEIEMKKDDRYLLVTIGNTYSNNIDLEKVGKKGFTTKGAGHGFGLSLVKDITKKNSKIETFNDLSNDMFKQIIMIDLK